MPHFVEVEHRGFEETLARAAELGGADLIFTSPPYPTARPGQYGGDAPLDWSWEDYENLGERCFSALKPGGFCIVIIDGPVRIWRSPDIGSERSLIAFEIALDWSRRVGFRYVEHEAYTREGAPGNFGPRRRSGWEPMHVMQRPGLRGYFDAWGYTVPAVSAGFMRKNACGSRTAVGKKGRGRKGESHHLQGDRRTLSTVVMATETGATIGRTSRTALVGSFVMDREHPAPFTRRVAEVQVLSYSPPGGLVCDPFNGSGTTGIAATKHGRSFIGGDLGARERDGRRWADIGRDRAVAAMAEFAASVGVSPAGPAAPPQAPIASGRGQMKLL